MYYIITLIRSKITLIFIITVLAVIFLEYDLLRPVFDIGLTPEDREFILRFKTFGPNPLTKIFEVWSQFGAYYTIPIYYIGIVESFTGFNYHLIQFVSVFFKTLATISIFPLILIVLKNKLLAFLTSILFAISYTTTGALETGVEPSEYLGFLMMNIFLITYYYLNTKYLLQLRWLILTALLLFIAVIASVMRVYPVLALIPAVEIFLWILNRSKYKFKYILIKLIVLYLPFLILKYYYPASISGHFALPTILAKIYQGNWHLLLTPFQGLGFMIPVGKYYNKLGILDLSNFNSYFGFILGGPSVMFGIISLIISWISIRNWLSLFLRIFTLNFALELLSYYLIQYRIFVPFEFRLNYDHLKLYPVLFGLFILSLALNYFIVWYNYGKKNNLYLVLWVGPFIGLFFITLTYFFAGANLSFGGAQDHYLLIPTLGISLFIAGVLQLIIKRLSGSRLRLVVGILLITTIILFLYGLNKEMIYNYFNNANINGRSATGQQQIQSKIKQRLKDLDYLKPIIVYFDTSDITGNGPFYSEGLLTPFPFFMHLDGEKLINGCIGVIYEDQKKVELRKMVKKINNQLLLKHPAICVNGYSMSTNDISIKLEDLYAYKIKNNDFIDIKEQVIDELKLE